MALHIEAERLVVEVDDPAQAAKLRQAIGHGAEERTIRGTDTHAGAVFPELYAAVTRAVDQLARRLATTPKPFVPAMWDPGVHAAFYNVTTTADGPMTRLDVSPGLDPVPVRGWLVGWLRSGRPLLGEYAPAGGVCSLALVADRAGEGYRMFSFGVGNTGGVDLVPVDDLVDAALAGLAPAPLPAPAPPPG